MKKVRNFIVNHNLLIIDVSNGLNLENDVTELWLSPNNYLMLANTIKKDLEELSSSKYAASKIEETATSIEEDLSILDAKLKSIADSANKANKGPIIIADDAFNFLESYGFSTVKITSETDITSNIKTKFKNKEYKYIFIRNVKEIPDYIKDLVDNYGVSLVEIKVMYTLSDEQRSNNDNYLTIMNDFINNLSSIVLS